MTNAYDDRGSGGPVSLRALDDGEDRRRAGGAEPAVRPGGGDAPGRDADQRADPELPAAPAGDAADADLGWAMAGARADGVHPEPCPEHSVADRVSACLS